MCSFHMRKDFLCLNCLNSHSHGAPFYYQALSSYVSCYGYFTLITVLILMYKNKPVFTLIYLKIELHIFYTYNHVFNGGPGTVVLKI